MNASSPGRRVGIDVGGTSIRVVSCGRDGQRTLAPIVETPGSYAQFLSLVADLTAEAAGGGQPERACCGLPGSSMNGTAAFVPALPWLEGRAVGCDLAARLGCPVTLGFDGQLTLLAEAREGAVLGHSSAVLVAVGTGIGGAVMTGGRIWRGHRGTAGSWGWLPATGAVDDPAHGAFEQVASGSALSRAASALDPTWDGPTLVAAARLGEPRAVAALQHYAERLGRGLAAIASIVDPEIVVVGGGVSEAMDVLRPLLDHWLTTLASPNGRHVPITAAALGSLAGVIGALHAASDEGGIWL